MDTKPCFLDSKKYLIPSIADLSWALVVGRRVHAFLGAPLGRDIAIGHEGGPRKPLAARVGHLVLVSKRNMNLVRMKKQRHTLKLCSHFSGQGLKHLGTSLYRSHSSFLSPQKYFDILGNKRDIRYFESTLLLHHLNLFKIFVH